MAGSEDNEITINFEIKSEEGWLPKQVVVPEGVGVNLILKNSSNAPAVFQINLDSEGQYVKKPEIVQPGKELKVLFFANYPKGTYTITNSWQHQSAGSFVIT